MENIISKQRVAVRAVIERDDGKILLVRESEKYEGGTQIGFYDFPGGKIEIGELFVDTIKREVHEEVGLDIKIGDPFYVDEWNPVIKGEKIQIIAIFFKCKALNSDVILESNFDDFVFSSPEEALLLPLMKEVENAIKKLL